MIFQAPARRSCGGLDTLPGGRGKEGDFHPAMQRGSWKLTPGKPTLVARVLSVEKSA